MTRLRAFRSVEQSVSHGDKLTDSAVKFLGFCRKLISIDPSAAIGSKHCADLLKREASIFSKPYQRKPLKYSGIKQSPHPSASH